MIRAEISVKGKVQKVGYRDKVKDIATELGLTGKVENKENGSVFIVCEGPKDKVEEFIEKIQIKQGLIDASVDKKKIKDVTKGFKNFKIVRGNMQKEMLERADVAVKYLNLMNQKIDSKIGKTNKEITNLRQDTNENFTNMDQKYGEISNNMENIAEELKEQRKILIDELSTFRNSVDSMGDKIESGIIKGVEKALEKQSK